MQVLEVIMQVPEMIFWGRVLMSEGKETLLEKKKANGIMMGSSVILSEIFKSE